MADSLNFPKQVTDLVDQTLKNTSGIAYLRPYLTDPNRNTPYDRSEFFQLRMMCIQQIAEVAVKTAGLKKEDTGMVCNKVLVTASEQMRKGVPLSDPTHLLAPYDLAQRSRGYGPADGASEVNAARGAKFVAELNDQSFTGLDGKDISAVDGTIPMVLKEHLSPEALPKNPAPGFDKMVYHSLKGGAKDGAFSYSESFNFYNRGGAPRQSSGLYRINEAVHGESLACSTRGTPISRKDCADNGYALATRLRLAR